MNAVETPDWDEQAKAQVAKRPYTNQVSFRAGAQWQRDQLRAPSVEKRAQSAILANFNPPDDKHPVPWIDFEAAAKDVLAALIGDES